MYCQRDYRGVYFVIRTSIVIIRFVSSSRLFLMWSQHQRQTHHIQSPSTLLFIMARSNKDIVKSLRGSGFQSTTGPARHTGSDRQQSAKHKSNPSNAKDMQDASDPIEDSQLSGGQKDSPQLTRGNTKDDAILVAASDPSRVSVSLHSDPAPASCSSHGLGFWSRGAAKFSICISTSPSVAAAKRPQSTLPIPNIFLLLLADSLCRSSQHCHLPTPTQRPRSLMMRTRMVEVRQI